MRSLAAVLAAAVLVVALAGVARALAQDATAVTGGGPISLTLVERAEHVTITDLGKPGPSAGDLTAWGPDPLFDATNTSDTGALTQGSCQSLNDARDNLCIES